MSEEIEQERDEFLRRVDQLFSGIESWIQPTGIKSVRSEISILEEPTGYYQAEKLTLRTSQGKDIAEIIPFGRWILGASGRIDVKGTYDNISVIYLEQGGPKAIITEHDGEHETIRTKYFYKGIDDAGWYWIDGRLGKGYKFDKDLFFDLLSEVADYERP